MTTRIREFRKLRNMTLQQLAQKVGTTAQTIQRLETDNMTVSLDWLEKIAVVFGVPSAALLMTEETRGIPVVGDVNAAGQVAPALPPLRGLNIVIAAADPIAIRTKEHVRTSASNGAFEPNTMLIGGKIERDVDTAVDLQDCIVAFIDGRIVLCRAGVTGGRIVLDDKAANGTGGGETDWIAPLLLTVRYSSL
jgi:transcriptional regulator with XRE-family HTH domain